MGFFDFFKEEEYREPTAIELVRQGEVSLALHRANPHFSPGT